MVRAPPAQYQSPIEPTAKRVFIPRRNKRINSPNPIDNARAERVQAMIAAQEEGLRRIHMGAETGAADNKSDRKD